MVYGSLATLAIFLLWIYYTSAIFLFGGEIASLLEQEKSIPVYKPGALKDPESIPVAVIWAISAGIGARTFSLFPDFLKPVGE